MPAPSNAAGLLYGKRKIVHPATRPTFAQRWLLNLATKGLNLILKTTSNPDPVFNRIINLGRVLCGMQSHYQQVGSSAWPYLAAGKGDPVVFLHGYGADKDRFGSLVPFFKRTFRVVIPDIPGFGDHAPDWSATYGIAAQAQRLERFIQAMGIETCHLMGISLGGYIAAYYSAHYPHRVSSLCLMASAGFSSPIASDALELYQTRNRNIFLYTSARQVQQLTDYLLHHPLKLPQKVKLHWAAQGAALLSWRKKLFDDLLAGGLNRMDDIAGRIKAPTLVVWGAQDRIFHVSTVDQIMALIDNCQAHIIKGCGHIPIIETPVLTRKIYMDFLRQVKVDVDA